MKYITEFFKNFAFGIVAGIAGMLPGSSIGTVAIVLNFFDKMVYSFSNIIKDFKTSFKFLLPFLIGVLSGIFGLASGITYLMSHFPIAVHYVFMGIIAGSIPLIASKAKYTDKKVRWWDYFACIFAFILIIALTFFTDFKFGDMITSREFQWSIAITMFGFGLIAGLGPIVPGLSGSLLLVTFGGVHIYLTTIHAVSSLNFAILIPYAIGILISTALLVKLFSFLFRKFPKTTYFVILGFVLSSLVTIWPGFIGDAESMASIFLFVFFTVVCFLISRPEIRRVRNTGNTEPMLKLQPSPVALHPKDNSDDL